MNLTELYESTKERFTEFQAQGKKYYYPVRLKESALKLLAHYSLQSLAKALGVTDKTLRNWQKATQHKQPIKSPEFISLTLPENMQSKTDSPQAGLSLQLPHGLSLTLPEQSASKTAQLICALVKEFSQCSI